MASCSGYSTRFTTNPSTPLTQNPAPTRTRAHKALNRPGRSCRHMPQSAPLAVCRCANASISVSAQLPVIGIKLPKLRPICDGRRADMRKGYVAADGESVGFVCLAVHYKYSGMFVTHDVKAHAPLPA